MPFFPEHNALFIHIPKNAGRSIEAVLLPEGLGPDSGRRPFLNLVARQFQKTTADPVPSKHLLGSLDVVLAAQHLTYQEIDLLGLLPRDALASAFSFCVVRNPYDRILSTLKHFAPRFQDEISLDTVDEVTHAVDFWLDLESSDHNLRAHRRPQSDYVITPRGDCAVTDILRFETLQQDVKRVFERLSIPDTTFPWVGKGPISKSADTYRDALSPQARKSVARAFEADLDMFKYVF